MKVEVPQTVTVDGKKYPVSQFSETVRRLVTIHAEWQNDLQQERLKMAKTEAALRALDTELSQIVATELQEQTGDASEAAPSAVAAGE